MTNQNIIAGILSFFIPGLGQMFVQDRTKDGAIFLLVWLISAITLIGLPIAFIAWIWSIIDALTWKP